MSGEGGRGSAASTYGPLTPSALRLVLAAVAAVLVVLAMPGVSHAVVSVSRAEVSGDRLRVEGTAAPSRTITVDGVAMGASDGGGRFRVERTGFTPPADCTVAVNDGSANATTARLAGCTETTPPPPPADASLSALTLSPTSVVGGGSVTGTVTLTAAAPSGGFVVSLSSNNPGLASVPPSVTVAAGATRASFAVTTTAVNDSQFATITASAGGVSRSAVLTIVPQAADRGSISLARGCVGPCGGGTVTSQPAGVSCTFMPDSTSGTCNNVFFPVGTEVKLEARPDGASRFQGWEFEVSCPDAPEVTIQAGVAHICRPVFNRR